MPAVSTYQQASEPTDLKPGTLWFKDDGKAYIRKLDLTWNYIGEWELPNLHHLHVEGGTMLGPIDGAHGLIAAHNPAFTGTATLNDVDLADKQWTTERLTELQESLENFIQGSIGGTSGNITIGNNLAIGYSTPGKEIADGGTIPLPIYSDGTRASKSEVCGVLASIASMVGSNNPNAAHLYTLSCSVDANLVVTTKWTGHDGVTYVHEGQECKVNFLIICKR